MPKTKIIATIGPASLDEKILRKLLEQGVSVVRINSAHGDQQQYKMIINRVRKIAKEIGENVAVMLDLEGPKIRLGELPEAGISFKTGDQIIFNGGAEKAGTVPVQYDLSKDMRVGEKILVQDGLFEFEVTQKKGSLLHAKAINSGILKTHKGINLPQSSITAPPLTESDRRNVQFAIAAEVDYVALSFVKCAADIEELRQLLKKSKMPIRIIAKIERHEAISNLEEIVMAADGLMVARGDLGVEIPSEQVPNVQKNIIAAAISQAKPVITATQMLYSMVNNPRPSRAEVTDVATAIFDHTDAVMLSDETAAGKYPVEAVHILRKTISYLEQHKENAAALYLYNAPDTDLMNSKDSVDRIVTNAISVTACKLARSLNARYIVCSSASGYTARQMAKYRPASPIVVFTSNPMVQRQMALVWGVRDSYLYPEPPHGKKVQEYLALEHIIRYLPKHDPLKPGDTLVIGATSPVQQDRRNVLHVYTY